MKSSEPTSSAHRPAFAVRPANNGGYFIDDGDRTVALITQQGYVDWLLRTVDEPGERLETIHKETHLSYIRGFKFNLHAPYLRDESGNTGTLTTGVDFRLEDGGARLVILGEGRRPDGRFESLTQAALSLAPDGHRYEWHLRTSITHLGAEPHLIRSMEFNNLCPALAYRGILHQGEKEFTRTLMQDQDGTVWEFPHQHAYHYGKKCYSLQIGTRSWAGFFDSPNGCPVVTVTQSPVQLHWEICDMYYDLHCMVRKPYEYAPGETLTFDYTIAYLNPEEAKTLAGVPRLIPISQEEKNENPRVQFNFGLNDFTLAVPFDSPSEACFYRPAPPDRVWDQGAGPAGKGALRLTSQNGETVVWGSEPPFHAINGTTVRIAGKARIKGVGEGGFYFRFHYYSFVWAPKPGFEPILTVTSEPISGTSQEWVTIALPPIEIPPGPVEDGMLRLDLVLEGGGVAWVTEVDVDLEASPESGEISEAATLPHSSARA